MWDSEYIEKLFSEEKQVRESRILDAHKRLDAAGYKWVGYHGTNLSNARKMVPDKLDPKQQGKGAGLARGPGFYVSGAYSLAKDYADESTQNGDPDLKTGEIPRKAGEAGKMVVLRVYACYFESMGLMSHYAWGIQCSSGDPNNDKKLNLTTNELKDADAMQANRHDMEIVFKSSAYPMLVVIPTSEYDENAKLKLAWKSHDDMAYLSIPPADRHLSLCLGGSKEC